MFATKYTMEGNIKFMYSTREMERKRPSRLHCSSNGSGADGAVAKWAALAVPFTQYWSYQGRRRAALHDNTVPIEFLSRASDEVGDREATAGGRQPQKGSGSIPC